MLDHDDWLKGGVSEKAQIEMALQVDGPHSFLNMFEDDIFLLDNWSAGQGLNYLIGIADIDSDRITLLNHDFHDEHDEPHITRAFIKKLERISKIWRSGEHPKFNPPRYYIDWAISKNIEIPWLAYATEKGYLNWKKVETDVENSHMVSATESIGRREIQHEIIMAVVVALGFDPLKIPDGGKAKIKAICLTRPRFFTPSSFDHAWKAGADLFKMANHEKFSSSN